MDDNNNNNNNNMDADEGAVVQVFPRGMYESGAMVQVFVVDKVPYVLVLKSAPIRTQSGQWWGTQTVSSDLINLPFWDIPGGKTNQFDDKIFTKTYFPRGGGGKDPMHVDTVAFPNMEHATDAACRETREETHGVVCPEPGAWFRSYTVEGGYTASGGRKSRTSVVFYLQETTRKMLTLMRMGFLVSNAEAFEKYNAWAEANPDAPESQHWDHRPEFDDMNFVRWDTLAAALNDSVKQLDMYVKDKKGQPKGVVCALEDYQGRTLFAVIRSWPVYLLHGNGLIDKIQGHL